MTFESTLSGIGLKGNQKENHHFGVPLQKGTPKWDMIYIYIYDHGSKALVNIPIPTKID